ncbi:EMILIN-2-like [Ruditapes philippinarum]|uniref:EMILIN-2-like n=1 Tax=Ruditapes philippinarum TaxID=129788 RepID=UPI00295AE8F2|nr:EMILIN-2-like [Ruditapes philippinarum]
MIRLEISVEAMKKEIEKSRNQARTTLDDLKEERIIWENNLKAKSDKRSTDLAAAIQETKATVQEQLKTLKIEKDKWNSELKDFVRIPELVLFSARNPKQTTIRTGLIMVFEEVLMNEGSAYNKDNGVFTVPYAGVYTFSVQLCVAKQKYVDIAFMANDKPFKLSRVNRHDTSGASCFNFDAVTKVRFNDEVKMKILSCDSSGETINKRSGTFWNTFSGRLVYGAYN